MRRKDREVTGFAAKTEIISRCQVCRIAMADEQGPYIVPMNFGFETTQERLTLFLHCASQGRKTDILTRYPQVAFEMDIPHGVITADSACRHSFRYESVVGRGRVEFLTESEDKIYALDRIMEQAAGRVAGPYEPKWLQAVTLLRIEVREFTAKCRE